MSQPQVASLPLNLFSTVKALLRVALFFLAAMIFILHHEIVGFLIPRRSILLGYYLRSIQLHARFVLWLFGIKTQVKGELGNERVLYICNHLSYVDALVLFAHYPSLFITSKEIEETFLLGRLTRLGGCFFVERRREKRNDQTITNEMGLMKKRMGQGFSVFLFPEGTSSDGSTVLPFKSTFFQLAIDGDIPVKPLVLSYTGEDAWRVPWYGKMTFPDHLFSLCQGSEILARVQELESMNPREFSSRQELAGVAYEIVKGAHGKN